MLHLIAKSGLAAWYHADEFSIYGNGQAISVWHDISGNNRNLEATDANYLNQPIYSQGTANGKDTVYWYYPPNNCPLLWTGNLTVRHAFVVGKYAGNTFSNYNGLLTDATATPILVGSAPGTNYFFNFSYSTYGAFEYRKCNRFFAESNQIAPVANELAVVSVKYPPGFNLNGIQLGQDRADTSRRWFGGIAEVLLYDRVLNEAEVCRLNRYFAMKYQIWEQNAAGLNVFSFPANWGIPKDTARKILSSVAEDGSQITRVKRAAKKTFEPEYRRRRAAEYDAARAFWLEHHPERSFIFRDFAFAPPRDTEVYFQPEMSLAEVSNGYNFIDYSLKLREK
jgi:hypothetical protein